MGLISYPLALIWTWKIELLFLVFLGLFIWWFIKNVINKKSRRKK